MLSRVNNNRGKPLLQTCSLSCGMYILTSVEQIDFHCLFPYVSMRSLPGQASCIITGFSWLIQSSISSTMISNATITSYVFRFISHVIEPWMESRLAQQQQEEFRCIIPWKLDSHSDLQYHVADPGCESGRGSGNACLCTRLVAPSSVPPFGLKNIRKE